MRTASSGSSGEGKNQQVKDNHNSDKEEMQTRFKEEEVQVTQKQKDQLRAQIPVMESAWSGEKVEDPDTDDIDLLLLNNYQNYKAKKNGGDYHLLDDGIEDIEAIEDLTIGDLTKDTDGDDEFEERRNLNEDSDEDVDQLTAGKKSKRGWGWRVARFAVPLQFALISLFAVARLFEPQCCDVVNNFSWSMTPHLRYVRGPPPM